MPKRTDDVGRSYLDKFVIILAGIACLNWGTSSIGFNILQNIAALLPIPGAETLLYGLVSLIGLYLLYKTVIVDIL
jgi:uncharacterized membrane protein YuzA (DUF378 family)